MVLKKSETTPVNQQDPTPFMLDVSELKNILKLFQRSLEAVCQAVGFDNGVVRGAPVPCESTLNSEND